MSGNFTDAREKAKRHGKNRVKENCANSTVGAKPVFSDVISVIGSLLGWVTVFVRVYHLVV